MTAGKSISKLTLSKINKLTWMVERCKPNEKTVKKNQEFWAVNAWKIK